MGSHGEVTMKPVNSFFKRLWFLEMDCHQGATAELQSKAKHAYMTPVSGDPASTVNLDFGVRVCLSLFVCYNLLTKLCCIVTCYDLLFLGYGNGFSRWGNGETCKQLV